MAKSATAQKHIAPKAHLTVEEFKEALLSGSFQNMGSMFNEQLQTAYAPRTFKRLRFEPRVAKLMLVPLLLSFPFNPLTGESNSEINSRKPFRPLTSPTEFLAMVKAACHENPELKKHYMEMAQHKGNWNTAPSQKFTNEDRSILFIYRRPMNVTRPGVRVNSSSITGNQYGQTYLLDSKQNEFTGEFEGEISELHRLGILANALQRNEINSFNQAIMEKKSDCVSIDIGRSFITAKTFTDITDKDSEAAKTTRGQIRSAYPLGNVSPITLTPMLGFDVTPLNGRIYEEVPAPTEDDPDAIKQELLPAFRNKIDFDQILYYTDKYATRDRINDIIGDYFPKDLSKRKERNSDQDLYPDFVILEWITNSPKTEFDDQERLLVASKMEATMERETLYHASTGWKYDGLAEWYENLLGFYKFIESDNFINRMPDLMFSNYQVANEAISDRAFKVFSETFNLGAEYKALFTSDIIAQNKEAIMLLWPDEFAEAFDEIEDKIEEGETQFQQLLEESSDESLVDKETVEEVIAADEVSI